MSLQGKVVRTSVVIFYLLIGLEIIIMISPFAAYFYAGYGPLLNTLYAFPATAWLTGFFLPHAVVSESSAKFRRKGVVTGIVYRRIRHPQYLFLAIAGLGLLLFWPRFFILILYVSMLFVYYLLARYEEQRMLAKHGESYRAYMQHTAMFLPGEPGAKIFRSLFGWIRSKNLALGLAYVVVLVLFTAGAFGLHGYTISKTSIIYIPEKKLTAVSIMPQADEAMQRIIDSAYRDSAVSAPIEKLHQQGHKGFLVHIMPKQYMMQGLFAQRDMSGMHRRSRRSFGAVIGFIFPLLSRRGHNEMMALTGDGPTRLIFSQLTWPNGDYASGNQALAFTVKHLPLLRVDVDTANGKVLNVEPTAPRNYWGQMPMPVF
jgi:protein-S-isoprenylcysteine O-methyltransferase Ste14